MKESTFLKYTQEDPFYQSASSRVSPDFRALTAVTLTPPAELSVSPALALAVFRFPPLSSCCYY